MNPVDYFSLESALGRSAANMGAAESHGLLCGMLCCRAGLDLDEWDANVFDESPAGDVLKRESLELMQELLDSSRAQFADEHFSFRPLLPDDDTDLGERAQAMAAWTQACSVARAGRKNCSRFQPGKRT